MRTSQEQEEASMSPEQVCEEFANYFKNLSTSEDKEKLLIEALEAL